jgi:pyroglutamyl-peptidase
MKQVILTGFGPFGPYKFNPTEDLVKEYDERLVGNAKVKGLVLPCTYHGAFDILSKMIDKLSPVAVLSTGLDSHAERLRLEISGENVMNGEYADSDGSKPVLEPIVSGGKQFYDTNADNIALASHLNQAGVPVEMSVEAGSFICNSLIYLTSRRIRQQGLPIKNAFVHTPWTDDYSSKIKLEPGKVFIPKKELHAGIEALINALVN